MNGFDHWHDVIMRRHELREVRDLLIKLAFEDKLSMEAIDLRAILGWPPVTLYNVRFEGVRIQKITTEPTGENNAH